MHDINRNPEKELVYMEAEKAFSPMKVAEKCKKIIIILSDSPNVEEVALGNDGLIKGVKLGTLNADMGTISITITAAVAKAMGEKNVQYLEVPVRGY